MDEQKDTLPDGITEEELQRRVEAAFEEKQVGVKKKQRKRLIGTIVAAVIEIIAVLVFIVAISSAASGGQVWIFGHSFSVVATGSMAGEIEKGDFIVVRECDIKDIEVGDNIVFVAGDGFEQVRGQSIVHKAIEINVVDGEIQITTKGVANPSADTHPVTAENFVGKQIFKSTVIGAIYSFLYNSVNWIFLIIVLLVLWFAVSKIIKLVKKARAEDLAAQATAEAKEILEKEKAEQEENDNKN